MNRPVRRKDREITREEAEKLLEQGEYGTLSTVGPEGQPYGMPLSYVMLEGKIYFHCALTGHRVDNLAHEQRVSFCVVGGTEPVYTGTGFSTYYESAVAFGRAEPVTDETERHGALLALCQKYLPDHMDRAEAAITGSGPKTAVYRIIVTGLTGKAKR